MHLLHRREAKKGDGYSNTFHMFPLMPFHDTLQVLPYTTFLLDCEQMGVYFILLLSFSSSTHKTVAHHR